MRKRCRSCHRIATDADPARSTARESDRREIDVPPAVVRGDVTISVAVIRRWLHGGRARLLGLRWQVDLNGDDDA